MFYGINFWRGYSFWKESGKTIKKNVEIFFFLHYTPKPIPRKITIKELTNFSTYVLIEKAVHGGSKNPSHTANKKESEVKL